MTNQDYEKACVTASQAGQGAAAVMQPNKRRLFDLCTWKTSTELVCDWSAYSDFQRGAEYEVFTGHLGTEPVCWVVAENGQDVQLKPVQGSYVSSDGMLGFHMPAW